MWTPGLLSEFSTGLPASATLVDEDFPKDFSCAVQGEDKDLFSISWKIGQLKFNKLY